ncbi:MAG: hypothetical protein HOK41_13480 [Nitrospina sp.]|nr:hypothetical protein [Nitrospina sp.]
MPKFSLIQAMTSIGIAIYFLLVFKRGIPVGADLWVMGIFQTVVTVGAWIYVRNHFRVRLFSFKGVRELLGYIYEGMPNWVFGLLYNTLITFGMLSIRKLTLGGPFQNHNDSFGNLQRVAMASQFILAFGGSVIYTRIVVWRHERDDFFLRVKLVCFAVITLGLFLCGFLHSIHNWLFPLIFPRTIYQSGAPYLSIVLFGRFLGLASGILVWSLLAYRKDWVAVKCAILPVLLSVGLHFYYVPLFGLKAASFLYIGGEMGLFLCCAMAFLILKKEIINKSA